MTKKQMKQLANDIAKCERIIQTSADKNEVNQAKNKQIDLTERANLDIDEMLALDELIQEILQK